MREPYEEDPASHPDPESCVRTGDGAGEALTGAHAGPVSSCEIRSSGVPTLLTEAAGHTGGRVTGERPLDPAQSETRCMRGKLLARETGDPSGTHRARPEGSAGEGHRPYARHVRPGEVGRLRSTWEAAEQGLGERARGGGGGKAVDQGERDVGGRVPDSEPDRRVDLSSSCAACGFVTPPPLPEVGAVCGNSARTDLRGGTPARASPTATTPSASVLGRDFE
jgi:hypothetical protein